MIAAGWTRLTEHLGLGGHSAVFASTLPSGIMMNAAGSAPHWKGFLDALGT
ncbi:MAG: hypothetical protein V9E82_03995 [Candidatus Nanopelagicales bacterium]